MPGIAEHFGELPREREDKGGPTVASKPGRGVSAQILV
jgi:hypothetical protein